AWDISSSAHSRACGSTRRVTPSRPGSAGTSPSPDRGSRRSPIAARRCSSSSSPRVSGTARSVPGARSARLGPPSSPAFFACSSGARSDYDLIPFGQNEGSGLSDPSVLTELFGWTTGALVRRYVVLGVVCLVGLAAVYVWGLWRARNDGAGATAQE